ncbi:MAG: cupredoxin family copper-binding protein [Candidatus Methanoperedens sp.]|nr:cupredoxin family copper-binding protein [Candidatus Methanoperedens sp.]
MKNVWIIGSLVLILLLSGCTSQPKATTPGETSGLAAKTATVEINNFNFIPAQVDIAKGGTVTWKQMDSYNHTVKSAGFDSGELSQGQTFQHKFDEIGIYDYWCNLHPSMKGKIIVK